LNPILSEPNYNGNTSPTLSDANAYTAMIAPSTCTIKALNLGAYNYGGGGSDTLTATVYINGNPTSMTTSVTTTSGAASSSDTTHTQSVTAGEQISIGFKESNDNGYNSVTIGLICQ
jgi:hypothetical protein